MDVKALKAGVSVLAVAATIVGSAAALSQEPKQVDLACHSFPPHLIDDPKGEKLGFDVDILKRAFEISGWQTAGTARSRMPNALTYSSTVMVFSDVASFFIMIDSRAIRTAPSNAADAGTR